MGSVVKRVNVGLIGAGFMGKAHSLAYAAMPMYFWPPPAMPVRRVIADISEEAAAEAARRFGFESSVGDWRSVVEDKSVDVIDIAVPNDMHPQIAIAAAEAGKHIICEKPLARTSAEARAMRDAVAKAGVIHMVAFNYRRTPAVAMAKKLITEGAIGEIRNFRATYLQDWSADPNSPLSWRFQRTVAGSGALGDIATHALDFARYLVGEFSAVNAVLSTWIPERPLQAGGADALGTVRGGEGPKGPVD